MKEEELCYIPQTLSWDPWRVRLCDWRQTEIDKTLKVRNPALTLSTGMRSSTVPIPSLSSPWICLINHKPGRDPPRLLSLRKNQLCGFPLGLSRPLCWHTHSERSQLPRRRPATLRSQCLSGDLRNSRSRLIVESEPEREM